MALNTPRPLVLIAALLLNSTLAVAESVHYELVYVGDAGNTADTTGYGAVPYAYQIGKYEVTIGQYVTFLNAVAKEDTYGLNFFASLGEPPFAPGTITASVAGISRTGDSGSYIYSALGPLGSVQIAEATSANRPMSFVNWFSAARFANWMSNGQPTGAQGAGTTEDGAYPLNGNTGAGGINPNTGAPPLYRIPTENEWYKAAYYKGGGTSAGYWDYATQSDLRPGNTIGGSANQANIAVDNLYAVTQEFGFGTNQNLLTDVGAFSGSPSAYGTFDMTGNIQEWNDLSGGESSDGLRGIRGGVFFNSGAWSSSYRKTPSGTYETHYGPIGFRLASPVPVPEPSTYAMALVGLACGGYSMWRRRKRA